VLTNGHPVGLAEAIALSFLDVVQVGEVEIEYVTQLRPIFDAPTAPEYGSDVAGEQPADPMPERDASAYVGT
jgi:hypothetical protein